MKKSYLVMAAAAALFAACSSDSNDLAEKQTAKNEPMAIEFDGYVNRGTTRAGVTGEMNNNNLKWGTAANIGFGVFGYYTDNQPYSETAIPNFFYNQQVKYQGTPLPFAYSPVKYWPNEYGDGAVSQGQDRLTFFAYAPFVNVIPGTGRIDTSKETATNALTSGIVGLTSNVTTGDPYVKYYVDFDPENRVDLCWGVAAEAFNSTVPGPTANHIVVGYPFIDLVKPEIGSYIKFDFKHALAALNVQIDADVDIAPNTAAHTTALDAKTKIYVRSVTFEGFATKGALNLNSSGSTPNWFELNSTNTKIGGGLVTIHDGRSNGKEGQANGEASNETPKDLNHNIIQTNAATAGVTNTAVNLFDSDELTAPILVIPNDQNMKVTIVYDVETEDDNLPGFLSDGKTKGSTVENAITQTINFGTPSNTKMYAGRIYTLKLHLGMTSVKFDASVTAWTNGGTDDVDLPQNGN